jgi:hypothetical protein
MIIKGVFVAISCHDRIHAPTTKFTLSRYCGKTLDKKASYLPRLPRVFSWQSICHCRIPTPTTKYTLSRHCEKTLDKKLLIHHDHQGGFRGNLLVIAEYPLQQRNTH